MFELSSMRRNVIGYDTCVRHYASAHAHISQSEWSKTMDELKELDTEPFPPVATRSTAARTRMSLKKKYIFPIKLFFIVRSFHFVQYQAIVKCYIRILIS